MTKKAKTVDKELPVELTTEEKAERGLALARLIKRRIDLMEEKKQFHAYAREKLLSIDERIAETQTIVRTGKEPRKVKCRIVPDYKANKVNKVNTIRTDTGEVVETRAMRANERQRELDLKADAKGADKPSAAA